MKLEAAIRNKFKALKGVMDERLTRLWAGAESEAMGRGGIAAVSRATGLAICTAQKGRNELRAGVTVDDVVNVRRKGAGGRKVSVQGATRQFALPLRREAGAMGLDARSSEPG